MLSVCIVNWNTKSFLRKCLASLAAHPPGVEEMEVIVVDNASGDGSAQMVVAQFPEVRLIASDENLGYAEGNNRALAAAKGDALLLLNPDVEINDGTLAPTLAFLRRHTNAAAVSVLFRNPDGTVQRSLRGFPSPLSLLWETVGLRRLFPKSRVFGAYFLSWFAYDAVIEVDQPMGTFLLISREAYEAVGPLDTQFPIFFNEVDWCLRARQAGWKIYFTPCGEIVHYGGQATKKAPKAAMVRESHRSLIKFYEKHYKRHISQPIYYFILFAIRFVERLRLLRAD